MLKTLFRRPSRAAQIQTQTKPSSNPSRLDRLRRSDVVTKGYRVVAGNGGATPVKVTPKVNLDWLTIGSDPEFMVWDAKASKVISSLRILDCSKNEPVNLGNGVCLYSDNIIAECRMGFAGLDGVVDLFRDAFTRIYAHLNAIEKGRYHLLPRAFHVYDASELTDKRAAEVGCTPSLRVWQRCMHTPERFTDGGRSAGAHIHLGYRDAKRNPDGPLMSMASKEEAIKLMDVFVGCASVIYDRDETATKRRERYGASGDFRSPDYGCEYRTPSNWHLRTPELCTMAHDLVAHAIGLLCTDESARVLDAVSGDEIQAAINGGDAKLERHVLTQAQLPALLMARVEREYEIPAFEKAWDL
jgi:hypothetical protein